MSLTRYLYAPDPFLGGMQSELKAYVIPRRPYTRSERCNRQDVLSEDTWNKQPLRPSAQRPLWHMLPPRKHPGERHNSKATSAKDAVSAS